MYTGGGGGLLSLLILVDIALAVGAKLRVITNTTVERCCSKSSFKAWSILPIIIMAIAIIIVISLIVIIRCDYSS